MKHLQAEESRIKFFKPRFAICIWQFAMLLSGCAMFSSPKVTDYNPQPTAEQRAWWEANKQRAHHVPGRGFYVEGVSGFFDANGRPLPSVSGEEGVVDEYDSDVDRLFSESQGPRYPE